MDHQRLIHPDNALARCQPIFENCEPFKGFKCPVDAKNDESESPEQHITLDFELPPSLLEVLQQLAISQAETNVLLQRLLLALMTENDDPDMPREDMEGRPIRDS